MKVEIFLLELSLGAIIGFISSIPIGPINLSIIATALKGNVSRSYAIGCSVALMDGLYAFIASSVVSMPRWSISVLRNSQICGAILIVGYGFSLIFAKQSTHDTARPVHIIMQHRNLGFGALTGVALYVSNPTFILFWIGAVGTLRLLIPDVFAAGHFLLGLGVTLGTLTWFILLLYWIRRSSVIVSPHIRKRLSIIAGFLLVALGAFALFNGFRQVLW